MSTSDGLLHLSRYLHLNPVRAGIVREPEDWPHSSYRTYVGWDDAQWISTYIILETLAPERPPSEQKRRYHEFVQQEIATDSRIPGALDPNLVTKEKT